MRMLSESELDGVFGGYPKSPSMDPITVIGYPINVGPPPTFFDGGSFASDEYHYPGGTPSCLYTSPYQALPSPMVPTPEKLRCVLNAVAAGGHWVEPADRISSVNSYAWRDSVTHDLVLQGSNFTAPGPNFNRLSGSWTGPNAEFGHDHITIYAGAMGSFPGNSGPYVDVNTGTYHSSGYPGPFNGSEYMILVGAHEMAHANGVNTASGPQVEERAEGYGVQAVLGLRAGAAAGCSYLPGTPYL